MQICQYLYFMKVHNILCTHGKIFQNILRKLGPNLSNLIHLTQNLKNVLSERKTNNCYDVILQSNVEQYRQNFRISFLGCLFVTRVCGGRVPFVPPLLLQVFLLSLSPKEKKCMFFILRLFLFCFLVVGEGKGISLSLVFLRVSAIKFKAQWQAQWSRRSQTALHEGVSSIHQYNAPVSATAREKNHRTKWSQEVLANIIKTN